MSLGENEVEMQGDLLAAKGSIEKAAVESDIKEEEDIEIDGSLIKDKMEQLKYEQNFGIALLAGVIAMLIGSAIWATVTALTEYQIGWMAIGVAFLVGFSIRYFGKTIDTHYGIMGAILSLMGCALGNLFIMVVMAAKHNDQSFFTVLEILNFELIVAAMKEGFQNMDVLFYGLALYYGYNYSFKEPEYLELKELVIEDQNRT